MPDTKPAPIDTMAPWTIKAFPTDARRRIVRAAEVQGVTVGQWIEQRLVEWERDPLEVPEWRTRGPGAVASPVANPQVTLEALVAIGAAHGLPRWLRAGAARHIGTTIDVKPPMRGPVRPPQPPLGKGAHQAPVKLGGMGGAHSGPPSKGEGGT